MTELEREFLATIERMNGSQMLQATTELTAAVKQMSVVLATFAEALMDMAYTNRQVQESSREIFPHAQTKLRTPGGTSWRYHGSDPLT
jgi:hypothetical protein